jgi:hypothetical protein
MGTLTALLLATPIFGFSLAPPDLGALPSSVAPTAELGPAVSLQISADLSAEGELGSDGEAGEVQEEARGPVTAQPAAPAPELDRAEFARQMKKRGKLANVHRTLGIATWAMTTLAVVGGTVQYRNLYGAPFTTGLADSPCVQGNAWPSNDTCYGQPWFHAITGFAAGGLYFTTAALALAMPDPDHADQGDSKFAKNVRTHKVLRWVHLTGMVTQMVLGVVMANPAFGLDRANDYDTLKLLSGIHLASGYVTLGALTWAGSIMLF